MTPITAATLRKFLDQAGERLEGDWVIVGGSVIAFLGISERVTLDIDIAGLGEASQKHTVTLMEIARELGLPVEAINQAAAFFLERIPEWRSSLVEIHSGRKARFFRPDVNLYLKLKIARLSESDLSDCLHMLRFAQQHQESLRKSELLDAIASKRATSDHAPLLERLDVLQNKVARARE